MNTKQLKEKILSLAIQGKLVPQDSNDEPAIELLKRINPNIQPIVEDIPFEIPKGWCWVMLKNICTKIVDGDHNPPKGEEMATPYIMASSININNDTLVELDKVRYLSKKIFDKVNERTKIRKGDILFTIVGTIGRSCVYNGGLNISFQRSVSILSTLINNYYLKYYLDSKYIQVKVNMEAKGIAQKGFYLKQLSELFVPIPPLSEQRRIVEKVESLFTLIDTIEKDKESIKENINVTRQKLLSMAIRGELVPQDPNDEPAIELLKRINPKFTPLQYDEPLPQGWSVAELSTIAKISTGNSINEQEKKNKYMGLSEGYNYIATKDISFESIIDYNNGVKIPYNTDFRIAHSGSTLLCIEGGSAGRKIGLLTEDVCYVNKLCAFETFSINNKYLYYYLQSPIFTTIFKSETNGLIGGVNQKKLKAIIIPIPPLNEQQRIVEKLEFLFAQLDDLEKNT